MREVENERRGGMDKVGQSIKEMKIRVNEGRCWTRWSELTVW